MGVIQIATYSTVTFIVVVLTSVPKHSVINGHVCEPAKISRSINLQVNNTHKRETSDNGNISSDTMPRLKVQE